MIQRPRKSPPRSRSTTLPNLPILILSDPSPFEASLYFLGVRKVYPAFCKVNLIVHILTIIGKMLNEFPNEDPPSP